MKLKRKAGSKLTSTKDIKPLEAAVPVEQAATPAPKEAPAEIASQPQQPSLPEQPELLPERPVAKPLAAQSPTANPTEGFEVPPALKFDDMPVNKPVLADVPQQAASAPPKSVTRPKAESVGDMSVKVGRAKAAADNDKAKQALGKILVEKEDRLAAEEQVREEAEAQRRAAEIEEENVKAVAEQEAATAVELPAEEPEEPKVEEEPAPEPEPTAEAERPDPFKDEPEKPPLPPEPSWSDDTSDDVAPFVVSKEDESASKPSGFTEDIEAQPFVPPAEEEPLHFTEEAEPEETPEEAAAPEIEKDKAEPFTPPENVEPPVELPKDEVQSFSDEAEPFVAPKSKAGTPTSSGDSSVLPWMESPDEGAADADSKDGWEIEGISDQPTTIQDIYSDMGADAEEVTKSDAEKAPPSGALPPWDSGETSNDGPPILPSEDDINTGQVIVKGDFLDVRKIIIGGLAVAVLFGAYLIFHTNREKTTEFLARWTGTLDEVSQVVVPQEDMLASSNMDEPVVQEPVKEEPEPEVIAPQEKTAKIELLEPPLLEEEKAAAVKEPEVPKDVSLFASMQNKIAQAREKQRREQGLDATEDPESATVEGEVKQKTKLFEGEELQRQLEQELAAYRHSLATVKHPALAPKPQEFFQKQKESAAYLEAPALDAPAPVDAMEDQANLKPNPQKLPIIGEPKTTPKSTVRMLEDFDVAMFEPPHNRVRVPKGIAPSLRAETFPKIELLSLVPGRGVIASLDGKEGVLLIGEVAKGWELISVYEEYAEFQNGSRRQTVTLN